MCSAAASLAINYLNFKDEDPEYAQRCLDTAIALYEFAKKYRGLGESGGFYGSSYDHDELAWAAVWLNIATGDMQYIDDIVATDSEGNYIGYMQRIIKEHNQHMAKYMGSLLGYRLGRSICKTCSNNKYGKRLVYLPLESGILVRNSS